MLIPFIENEVQDAFGLDLAPAVGLPDLESCLLMMSIMCFQFRDNNEFFEGIVEMLLVVVKGRVLILF